MPVIVTDAGFGPDDFDGNFVSLADLPAAPGHAALDLASDTDPASLSDVLDRVAMIRVDFPTFADGRGFSIARQVRLMGYTGRLRARGHLIADQYAMARRCGFDEVEISEQLAARQPAHTWIFRAETWARNDYQARLSGNPST